MEEIKGSAVAVAKINDAVLNLLANKRSNEISSQEGRDTLRQELAGKVKGALGGLEVADVLLTDFIIQY